MTRNLTRDLGFLLEQTGKRFIARFNETALDLTLTPTECRAVLQIDLGDGITQVRLAELVGAEPMAIVRLVDRMASANLIVRRNDPSDRRVRRLFLTSHGRSIAAKIRRAVDLTNDVALSQVSDAQLTALFNLLTQIKNNLGD